MGRGIPFLCAASLLIPCVPVEAGQTGSSAATSQALPRHTRVCQTPGPLLVESLIYRHVALYIYVPQTTRDFDLGLKWRNAGAPLQKPATFRLFSPDRQEIDVRPGPEDNWSKQRIQTRGAWGIWQLRVETGKPKPGTGAKQVSRETLVDIKGSARTLFAVRTTGEVDLFARPGALVSYRGALALTSWDTDTAEQHRFLLQVPRMKRLRINFRLPEGPFPHGYPIQVEVRGPDGLEFQQRWVGLTRSRHYEYEFWRLEYLELTGDNLEGLWTVSMNHVAGGYRIGCEQGLPFIFSESALMPMPVPTRVHIRDAETGVSIPARLEVSSAQTARAWFWGKSGAEIPQVVYTGPNGTGQVFLMPGPEYTLTTSSGPEYGEASLALQPGMDQSVALAPALKRAAGWYCGDNHIHTVYSDGSSTPAQVVGAALGEGLDWITLTDHSLGPDNTHAKRAYEEARGAAKDTGLLVMPGEEFTAGNRYHANVINGMIELTREASLEEVVDAVLAKDTDQHPITVKWNHPGNGEGVPESHLKRLPLLELRMGDLGKSDAIQLWGKLLNEGIRVFAESSSDSHSVSTNRLGSHRTCVYLGEEPLTAGNVVRALREGRSFVSRGALVFLKAQGALPGRTLRSSSLDFEIDASSRVPMARVEIVHGGTVFHTFQVNGQTNFSTRTTLRAEEGWYLARVIAEGVGSPVLAMTNPIFVDQ